jgi:hypothetical protein
LILDPDGNRIACDRAAFIWHDQDPQGNLIADDQFEIGMGTLSGYVGVQPDPSNPGQVIPVWGTAEALNLSAQAKVQIDGKWADPFIMGYGVHPEPWAPDHFECWEGPNLPCGDLFEYWTGILSDITTWEIYYLTDAWSNTTFGCTNISATQPGSGVTVGFADQTSGQGGGDFAGYAIRTQWGMYPPPSGTMTSTLSVAYPDDPAGDWGGGTASKTITYQFDGGSSHVLIQRQNYDNRFGVDDGGWPLVVPPGAGEGAMPKTTAGDTPRLVLLALTGTTVSGTFLASPYYGYWGPDEPSLDPTHVYHQVGVGYAWTPQLYGDAALEAGPGGAFRLSLEDDSGNVIPNTAFRVYPCPRFEHLTSETPPGDCTLGPVASDKDDQGNDTGILSSLNLNDAGGQRGYMGIELTKAPVNPGQYYIVVRSIGGTAYRIRWESQLIARSDPSEDLVGGFVICTVLGAEILDGNFQRINPEIVITEPTPIYVRYLMGSAMGGAPTMTVKVDTRWPAPDGTVYSPAQDLTLTQLASSGVYLGQATLTASDGGPQSAPGLQQASGGPSLPVPGGPGTVNTSLPGNTGKPNGTANTAKPLKLKIQFLDANGQNVVAQPVVTLQKVADPTSPGHSIYVEETMARVAATLPDSGAVDQTARGYAGLREQANGDLEIGSNGKLLQFSYAEPLESVATVLAQYGNPQVGDYANKQYTVFQLVGGYGPIMNLDSIAQPRKKRDNTSIAGWDSLLVAVPAISGRAQGYQESDPEDGAVPQWVDSYTYYESGKAQCPPACSNGIPDWLEATAWDAVMALRSGASSIEQDVGNAVIDIKSGSAPNPGEWAFVDPNPNNTGPRVIQIDASAIRSGDQAVRRDGLSVSTVGYHGLQLSEPNRLTDTAKHEARHCWQNTLPDQDPNPQDPSSPGDLIPDVVPDPMAPALQDSPFFKRGSGLNTEFDFFGPGEMDDPWLASDARERDAMRWEARIAGASVASNLKCVGGPVTLAVSALYPIYDFGTATIGQQVPLTVLSAQSVVSEAAWGQPTRNFVTGITVQLTRETTPLPGDTTNTPGNPAAMILDPNQPDAAGNPGQVTTAFRTTTNTGSSNLGVAIFSVVPAAGLNIFSAVAWNLTSAGDGSGAQANVCGFSQPQKIYIKIWGTQ